MHQRRSKSARRSTRSKARSKARIGRRADDPPVVIPQDAEVVDRNEYLVRVLRSNMREVKVFATSADVAGELASNGLGVVTSDEMIYGEIRSVNQIG